MSFIQPPFWGQSYPPTPTPCATSSLVVAPTWEPLTLEQGKLRAGLSWEAGDERDALMEGFIQAARQYVEEVTGLALPEQTRDVTIDRVTANMIVLPAQSRPLRSVTWIKTTDTAGNVNTLATSNYHVDLATGVIGLSDVGVWPTDLRGFKPWSIRIVSGYLNVAAIPPVLVHAVGALVAHYATGGRDLAPVPDGFDQLLASFTPVDVV